jgi:hypothetical protein
VARLWKLVATHNDRRKFARLCGRLSRPVAATDAVASEVVAAFVRDETLHRLHAIGVPVKDPLCKVRPLEGV